MFLTNHLCFRNCTVATEKASSVAHPAILISPIEKLQASFESLSENGHVKGWCTLGLSHHSTHTQEQGSAPGSHTLEASVVDSPIYQTLSLNTFQSGHFNFSFWN